MGLIRKESIFKEHDYCKLARILTSACLDMATLSFSLSDVTTFARFVLITEFSLSDDVPNVSPEWKGFNKLLLDVL